MAPDPKSVASDAFKGTAELTFTELEKLAAPDLKTAMDKIIGGWRGKVTAVLTCSLGNDTRTLADTRMRLIGEIFDRQTKTFASSRFWESGTPLNLNIHSLDGSKFIFKEGLTSELLDWSEVDHSFTGENSNVQLSNEEILQAGFPGFALRAYLWPISAAHLKLNIAFYPLNKAKLIEENPQSPNFAFPGFSCFYGDIQLHPISSKVLPYTNWGSPVAFILICETPLAGNDMPIPPTSDFRAAIAALLRKAVRPEIKANTVTLHARWDEIKEGGEAALLAPKSPDLIWPAPSTPVNNPQGRTLVTLFIFSFVFF